jgi:hypothetical protein
VGKKYLKKLHKMETKTENNSEQRLQEMFLIPYLPYGIRYCEKKLNYKDFSISFIERGEISTKGSVHNINNILKTDDYYPILKPISDLEHKSSSELKSIYGVNDEIIFWLQELTEKNTVIKYITLETYTFLLQHHFDIFNLIKDGLAVSIHDVKDKVLYEDQYLKPKTNN